MALGGSKIGKSSLIESLVNDDSIDSRKSFHPLFQTKNLEHKGKYYTINIWDSSNTDSVSSVNRVYFRDANVVLLCYDVTKIERGIASLELWYEKISQNTQPKCGRRA